ncbi:permease [uncultured Abyssibacter sp.]|uniref:permease n=1 Tax=uncultured Abyssibacter sp. TaxID=2320202 RepID=UPI0032B27CFB
MHLVTLLSSLIALLFGPLAYAWLSRQRRLSAVLDGFVFVSIAGIVLLEALPDAVAHGGVLAWLALAIGMFGPTLAESLLHHAARETHLVTLLLGGLGLILHATVDGAALSEPAHAGPALALAVVLHRIPVGLAIWWLVRPTFGVRAAWVTLVLMLIGTTVGYGMGGDVIAHGTTPGLAIFQAFIAGSILHVVFNKPHLGDRYAVDSHDHIPPRFEGLGNVLGLGVVLAVALLHGDAGHESSVELPWARLLDLTLISAPALLLGFLLAAALGTWLPEAPVRWLQRGPALRQAWRGMLFGLPLPVCSCGVLPVYRTLIRRGVPGSAGIAFLVATPELGLDAILLSLPLLGDSMTLARVVAAAILALLVGWWVGPKIVAASQDHHDHDACCGSDADAPEQQATAWTRFRDQLDELVRATGPWLIVGLVLAAIAEPLLEQAPFMAWPGAVQVLFFAVIGIPIYVCASGATPIVAILLAGGLSPGAGLAFLLSGPATNVASFGLLRNLHDRATAIRFAVAMIAGAVVLGLLTNAMLDEGGRFVAEELQHQGGNWMQWLSLLLLGVLVGAAVLNQGARRFFAEGLRGEHAPHSHQH